MLTSEEWLEMFDTLRAKGYSEPQIAAFNRVSMLELRWLRARKLEAKMVSAGFTPPIVEGGEDNEKD